MELSMPSVAAVTRCRGENGSRRTTLVSEGGAREGLGHSPRGRLGSRMGARSCGGLVHGDPAMVETERDQEVRDESDTPALPIGEHSEGRALVCGPA